MPFWSKDNTKMKPSTLLVVGIVVIAALLAFGLYKILTPKIDTGTYQLIRVESGESYVGKLSHANADYIELNDVYVYEANTENKPEGENNQAAANNDDNLTLLPVSSIKGTMYVSRQKVVYWGNLSNEGPVVNAIKSDKNKLD